MTNTIYTSVRALFVEIHKALRLKLQANWHAAQVVAQLQLT